MERVRSSYAPLIEELFLLRQEIRRSQEAARGGVELRTFWEDASCGMTVATEGRRIVYMNRFLAAALGRPRETCLGEDIVDFIFDEDREKLKALFAAALSGERYAGVPLRCQDLSGSPVAALGSLFALPRHPPDPVLVVMICLPDPQRERRTVRPPGRHALAALTRRELEVCRHIRNGLSSKEIAHTLSISAQSVQTHRHHIRRKLGLLNSQTNLETFLKTSGALGEPHS